MIVDDETPVPFEFRAKDNGGTAHTQTSNHYVLSFFMYHSSANILNQRYVSYRK